MKRFFLYVALIALLPGLSTRAGLLYAAGAKQQAAVAQNPSAPNPADFVGSDTCAACHADVAKKFSSNPHSRLALLHNGTGATCESCHGPGRAHVEGGGDVTKIKQLSKLSAQQVDETCLGCHAGAHPNFLRSPHARAGVSCTSCHSVHNGDTEAKLLKAAQPKLCFQCHADVKPAFDMPFHHKVNEGLLKCSDCHDVHGTFGNNNIRSTADQNAICTKCHTETRGPFVYEHPVVRAEGCIACHTPHGSQNARLLNMPNIQQLCYQCHGEVAADTVHGMKEMNQSASCVDCHTMIHGSNLQSLFFK
jgi:DmsE family decaheme c-type cytochrome